jgi:hypothetical protein
VPLEESEGKSKSQRLRACLYRLWEQEYKWKYETFELFYSQYMEKVINKVKDNLI